MSKFCPHCGTRLDDDSLFCDECGTPLQRITPEANLQPENKRSVKSGKSKKLIIVISVVAICIFASIGIVYLFLNQDNKQEDADNKQEDAIELVKESKYYAVLESIEHDDISCEWEESDDGDYVIVSLTNSGYDDILKQYFVCTGSFNDITVTLGDLYVDGNFIMESKMMEMYDTGNFGSVAQASKPLKPQNTESTNQETKETENTSAVDEPQDPTEQFVGSWYDIYSSRCNMLISYSNGTYTIVIDWGSSAWDNCHWEFTGEYQKDLNGIAYTGFYREEHYLDNGEVENNVIYKHGTGMILLGNDGNLYWQDDVDNQGRDCIFVRQ